MGQRRDDRRRREGKKEIKRATSENYDEFDLAFQPNAHK